MANAATITILMATYNGARHLRDQLNSIIEQSYTDWQLIIRDDGSADHTLQVLNEYKHDERIKIINTASSRKGACANFSALYAYARQHLDITYLMFADQDDIWHPQKIEKTFNAIKTAELSYPNEPVMVYTHLYMITEDGKPIDDDFTLLPHLTFNITLAQNYALGCTTMLNKALTDIMPEIPVWAENHDYWVTLVASSLGRCVFVNEKMIQYRQHGANVTTQGSSLNKRLKRFTTGLNKQMVSLQKRIIMLKGFLNIYQSQLSNEDKVMLQAYLSSFKSTWFNIIQTIRKYNIRKLNLVQDIGFLLVTATYYRQLKKVAQE
ncbi:glycosyltransferase family 2 protein [Mucilaginibacter sp.]